MGVPPDIEMIVASTAEAAARLPEWNADPRVGIVVVGDVGTLAALTENGGQVARVNVGGIHQRPGRTERLRFVFLTDAEAAAVERSRRPAGSSSRPRTSHGAGGPAGGVHMTLEQVVLLLVWGTLVGLDLVSMPQAMIARPLVAGALAGAMLGDLGIGLQVGVIFELFQYDIIPMGAVRYPEYGPATVAAVGVAHTSAGALGIGLGAVVGLVTGLLGGISIHLMRRMNARAVRRNTGALERGDISMIVRLHVTSTLRDAVRAALVTAAGLALGAGVHALLVGGFPVRGAILVAVVITGAAIAAGAVGTLRLVGRGPDLRWFAAGVLGGAAGVWLR